MSIQRDPLPTRVQGLAPLPAEYGATLEAGLADLGIVLTAAQRVAIDDHVRLLLAWTGSINLTAIREPVEVARFHVLDALTAVPLLREAGVGDAAGRLLDLGSGGGFPGLPLAITLGVDALLVDSVAKKVRFLETAVAALGVPGIRAHAARAEALATGPRHRAAWPTVTARAVAPLAELVELAFPLLEVGGRLVAWKRGDVESEVHVARKAMAELGGGSIETHPAGLRALGDHRLVVARKTRPTPGGWPRDPAARRRRPW